MVSFEEVAEKETASSSAASDSAGSSFPRLRLDDAAYSKVVAHAAKFPWANVNGLLIGAEKKEDGSSIIMVTDAVPLFHSVTLAPMTEVACMLVEEYCASAQTPEGTKIVGAYYCDALPKRSDATACKTASALANKISATFSSAAIVQLRAEKMGAAGGKDSNAIVVYRQSKPNSTSSKWVPCDGTNASPLMSRTCHDRVAAMISSQEYTKLDDFDDCMADVTKDWRNPSFLFAK